MTTVAAVWVAAVEAVAERLTSPIPVCTTLLVSAVRRGLSVSAQPDFLGFSARQTLMVCDTHEHPGC